MLVVVGITLVVAGSSGVAHAFERAFSALAPEVAPVTTGGTGSVAIELDDGAEVAFTTAVSGLRPDDTAPGDDLPTDAFADRVLVVRNDADAASTVWLAVAVAPDHVAIDGLHVSVVTGVGSPTLVVADTAVPIAPAPVATLLPGESVMVRVRFRLAHTAAVSGMGATTALRVTVGADSRAGANR